MADTSTLADFNNNPGNIRPLKGMTYDGQIGVDDKGFAVFENKDAGRKALLHDIQVKIGHGLNSPEAFVDKYAPAGDNTEEERQNYKIKLAEALGMDSTNGSFPENSHEKIADAITQREGGVINPSTGSESQSEPESQPVSSDTNERIGQNSDESLIPERQVGEKTLSPNTLSMIGGGIGVATGIGSTGIKKTAQLAKGIYDRLSPPSPTTAPSIPRSSINFPRSSINFPRSSINFPDSSMGSMGDSDLLNTDAQTKRILQGGEGATEGTTGRARQTGYNVQTAQEAARKRDAEAVLRMTKKTGTTAMDASQFLANQPTLTASPAGVIYPRSDPIRTMGPRTYVDPSKMAPGDPSYTLGRGNTPIRATSPLPSLSRTANTGESMLGKIARYAGNARNIARPLANIGISGFSGAMAANDLYNAEKDRQKSGLTVNNAIDYSSGLGGAIGMIPTLPTQVIGGLLQTPAGIRFLVQNADKFRPQPSAPNDIDFTGGP